MRIFQVFLLLVVGFGVASGCSKGASEPTPGASQGNEAPPVPVTGTVSMDKLSDGQIATVLTTVDDGEIEQAQAALKRATNPEVRAFATHMVDQHTASKQAGAQLVSQTGLKPAESPKSKELQAAGAQHLERLNAADDANFDITYLSGQIDQHETVLKLIEDQLLPAVNEPALRDHL
ncbi:MAG TPA: DUF4142 domain-containing protein, partial [Polyangiales bacterium]|nr:DUF4142 domain-containing protein [Polyangiales bacterium]